MKLAKWRLLSIKWGHDVANMVRKINASATQLAVQSEELSASSEESMASSEMVAKTAENQMIGSEQQRNYRAI